MAKHRKFSADRFLDKFQGHEPLLRAYVGRWNGHLGLDGASLDVPLFKEFLTNGGGAEKDDLLEGLYRAFDLCTDRGHEDLVAACRDFGIDPPEIPVECLALKVLTENESAFHLAHDRNTLWLAERFTVYRGHEVKPIGDVSVAARLLEQRLGEIFKASKKSDRVLVRHYSEGDYANFIVYHEKRTRAELTFRDTTSRPQVAPTVFRPAQQDFISYSQETGQVEIEARSQNDDAALRKSFAECCLGEAEFFEGPDAADRIDLARITDGDFEMKVDREAGHGAALVEIHFGLPQQHAPSFVIRSKNVMETLDANGLRGSIGRASIRRAVFRITFPDDLRGKRVELAGANSVKFKRATHAEEVFGYLRDWKLLRA